MNYSMLLLHAPAPYPCSKGMLQGYVPKACSKCMLYPFPVYTDARVQIP